MSPRDALRIAVLCWIVFAIALAAMTVMRKDSVKLLTGDRIVGRVLSQSTDAVTIRTKSSGNRTILLSEIDHVTPLGDGSVTGVYRRGSMKWWSSIPLYMEGVHGFLYLPQAAMLFTPFEILPPRLGEVLWRWVGLMIYAWGVWRLVELLCSGCRGGGASTSATVERGLRNGYPTVADAKPSTTAPGVAAPEQMFLIATLLAIPAALGSASNGQTNLVMGGLLALGAVDCSRNRYWWATLWLMLAFACKPVAIPVILLLAAVYPRMIPKLAVGVLAFIAAPFLHPDPAYVWNQYPAAIAKLRTAGDPQGVAELFSDIRGMLTDFGLQPDAWWVIRFGRADALIEVGMLTIVRGLAAFAALGACLVVRVRFAEPWRAVYVLAFGAAYIMIFNPRTEGVTYAMIGPVAAVFTTHEIMRRNWWAAVPLIAYCLILQFSLQITGPVQKVFGPLEYDHKYWLRPLCALGFAGYLCWNLLRAGRPSQGPEEMNTGAGSAIP